MLKELENSCLKNFKNITLQQILADPGNKRIPKLMIKLTEDILEISSNKKVSKKVVSRLARTMALATTCGARHNDIDQAILPREARRIRELVKIICRCKVNNLPKKKISTKQSQSRTICEDF